MKAGTERDEKLSVKVMAERLREKNNKERCIMSEAHLDTATNTSIVACGMLNGSFENAVSQLRRYGCSR